MGEDDGDMVGDMDGLCVGLMEGERLGLMVGDSLGDSDGDSEGNDVGDKVGDGVGLEVGDGVGDSVISVVVVANCVVVVDGDRDGDSVSHLRGHPFAMLMSGVHSSHGAHFSCLVQYM